MPSLSVAIYPYKILTRRPKEIQAYFDRESTVLVSIALYLSYVLLIFAQQGLLLACVAFALEYNAFMMHVVLLSICSAIGQVFIFTTLSSYGALVFAIIMTSDIIPIVGHIDHLSRARQVLSIFLSASIFEHQFSAEVSYAYTMCGTFI